MKIILSPSKTMNLKDRKIDPSSQAHFLKESEELRRILQKDSLEEIQKRFKISERLSQNVYSFYQDDFPEKAAIETYTGQVFANINYEELSSEEKIYAHEHLRILSALYGVLRPLDAIKPYRLDFIIPFPQNLYEFWGEKVQSVFPEDEIIVNLASKEFSKLFDPQRLFDIHFINEKGRSQSTMAKKARGAFARQIIEAKCSNIDELRKLELQGFKKIDETDKSITFQQK